jgi:hypothetical protein
MRTRVLMSKRRTRSGMVQQDLFATRPPPAPEATPAPEPAVQAAAHYERVMRKRSEVVPIPFATGPISHATGGPLSAEEAERVISRRTIRCSGYQWQDGIACCKACFDKFEENSVAALHLAHGYRGVLYGGAEYKGGLVCFRCGKPIAP